MSMQAKFVYIASDALPGGQIFSSTYKKGGEASLIKRTFYESVVSNMTQVGSLSPPPFISSQYCRVYHDYGAKMVLQAAEEMGLTVFEHFSGSQAASSSIVDQLICSRAPVFIGTCSSDTRLLTGDKDCTFPRRICGNYGIWIFRYRSRLGIPIISTDAANGSGKAQDSAATPGQGVPYTALI